MKINKYGRFADVWNGDGWFVSWITNRGFFLIAFRPMRWRFAYVRLPMQRWVRRLYFGPLEFEVSRYGSPP